MERSLELAPELTVSLADFKSVLKFLKISATTVWDGELMVSFEEWICTLSCRG